MDDGLIREVRETPVRSPMNWTQRFFVLLAAVTLLRLLYVAVFPCDLVGDEAYYWDWGRRLSWGYFSKPPFIAWMMAGAGALGGDTVFGLRMWAVLFGSGSMCFTFLLGRRLYGEKAGFFAGALIAAMPGAALLNLLLTIDAPLVFFWTAALFCFVCLLDASLSLARRVLFAALLTLVLGLGHLSKQMMWLFPLLAVIFLSLDKPSRAALKSPLLWTAFGLSYLFLVPTLLWNARHGWITFLHTGHHFQGDGIQSFPKNFGDFVGMQILAVSPLVAVLFFTACLGGVFVWKRIASRERLLVLFSGLPLLVMLAMTLRQALNGNWAAAFYPAGLVLVAGVCLDRERVFPPLSPRMRGWLKPGLWVALAFALLVLIMPFVVSLFHLQGSHMDPYPRLRGWKSFAGEVQKIRETLPQADAPILVVGHRYDASELAFYLPGQPRVYHWPSAPGAIDSQYDLWGGLDVLEGREITIVLDWKEKQLPDSLRGACGWVLPVGTAKVEVGHGRVVQADVYRAFYKGVAK